LHDRNQSVHRNIADHVDTTPDPFDLDLVDLVALTEAEVEPFAKVALITPPAVDFVHLAEIARGHGDMGANAIAVGFGALQLDLNPMIGMAGIVSEDGRLAPGIKHYYVYVAIVI
jgi:hypothetical protein